MQGLTCCMVIKHGNDGKLVFCDKLAESFYKHNGDVCSYCKEHDYVCGEPLAEEQVEKRER